jgi:hypothetical protein
MNATVTTIAWVAAAINVAAALVGAWAYRRFEPSALFWRVSRAGQGSMLLFAIFAIVLFAAGHRPDDDLFWIYVLVPLGVSFAAEQFRLLAARSILDSRELEDAQAMRRLPDDEQRWIVTLIQRREIGVMAVANVAIAFLLVRAAMTAAGF